MDVRERLMGLWNLLRHPEQKPPVSEDLDARLDEVERRIEQRRQARYERLDAHLPTPKGR